MNKTHIPGPWRVEGDSLVVAGRYGLHIASVSTTGMGHAVLPNAKLIAAAPALLAALQEARKFYAPLETRGNSFDRAMLATMQNAIDLATGKEG